MYIHFFLKYKLNIYYTVIPVVPHKAVAEVLKIGNLYIRRDKCRDSWMAERTDGPKGG